MRKSRIRISMRDTHDMPKSRPQIPPIVAENVNWIRYYYRVGLVVCHLGWVDIDLCHSTACLVHLGQMGIWLYGLACWER